MSNPEDSEFDKKYGAPYEGLKQNKRWSLFLPFMLCVRRLSFMFVVLNLPSSAYAQLWAVQFINIICFVYVIQVRPYYDEFLNKMETFNEIVNILCIDLLFSFTGVINRPSEEQTIAIRDQVGLMFIGLLLATVGVHLAFLIGGQVKKIKIGCTRKAIKSRWLKLKVSTRDGCSLRDKPCIGLFCKMLCRKSPIKAQNKTTESRDKRTAPAPQSEEAISHQNQQQRNYEEAGFALYELDNTNLPEHINKHESSSIQNDEPPYNHPIDDLIKELYLDNELEDLQRTQQKKKQQDSTPRFIQETMDANDQNEYDIFKLIQ